MTDTEAEMASARTRRREFTKLKGQANELLAEQIEVATHATKVLKEASRQAERYAREDVVPRVRKGYDERVRPSVAAGRAAASEALTRGRARLADDVIPAVGASVGSGLARLATVDDPRVQRFVKDAGNASKKWSAEAAKRVAPPKQRGGIGRWILLGFGLVTVLAVGYAAWQTLRADDELWIEDVADLEG